MQNDFQNRARRRRIAGVAMIIVVIVALILLDHLKNSSASTALTTPPAPDSTPPPATSGGVSLKDGTYSATSQYAVPSGSEAIKVTLTVQSGVITASQIQNTESDRDSAVFQEEFAAEYKSQVVGKSLASLHVDAVAGASDTAHGFNEAISSIRSQAGA